MSFLANPRQFLENHSVIMSEAIANPEMGGVRDFRIAPLTVGSQTHVIAPDDGQGESFRAFWVPYQANHYGEYDLSSARDYDEKVLFILTFTLSGCTFAAGTGRKPKLAHINYQTGNKINQNLIDQDLSANFDQTAAVTLKKAGYFGKAQGIGNNKYTVIGVLEENQWVFYLNTKGTFSNGLKAWELRGLVNIPEAGAGGIPAANADGRGRGGCTLL